MAQIVVFFAQNLPQNKETKWKETFLRKKNKIVNLNLLNSNESTLFASF